MNPMSLYKKDIQHFYGFVILQEKNQQGKEKEWELKYPHTFSHIEFSIVL